MCFSEATFQRGIYTIRMNRCLSGCHTQATICSGFVASYPATTHSGLCALTR